MSDARGLGTTQCRADREGTAAVFECDCGRRFPLETVRALLELQGLIVTPKSAAPPGPIAAVLLEQWQIDAEIDARGAAPDFHAVRLLEAIAEIERLKAAFVPRPKG